MAGNEQAVFAYDRVAYPDVYKFKLTPDHMAAVARRHGRVSPAAETASFLEIGGARGVNAMAVAAAFPRAKCVNFDLSVSSIASGQALVAAAGLRNIELQQADILTYPHAGEKFDYIACHGVYSWVPQPVREALLALIGARLAPGGIAYLGYDCLPAAAGKQAITRLLIESVSHIPDLTERVETAWALIGAVARNQRPYSRLQPMLDQLLAESARIPQAYFFHDWLAEQYSPITIPDLAKAAAPHGLAFLGDASMYDLDLADLDETGQSLVAAAGDDPVSRNVTIDLLRGIHSFRADLFVRADAPPPKDSTAIEGLRLEFGGKREPASDDRSGVRYSDGSSFSEVNAPGVKAALDALLAAYPEALSFGELGAATGLSAEELEAVIRDDAVIQLTRHHSAISPFVLEPAERPVASPLVRAMLAHGEDTVSLGHDPLSITDNVMRLVLVLCDGSRTYAEIASGISAHLGVPAGANQAREAIRGLATRRLFAS